MAQHRVKLTYSDANWKQILARWETEAAYKKWVKAQTLAESKPGAYHSTYTERM